MAFEARAEERETRGFISMMTMRPLSGFTANWMLDPPVSTPTARITAKEASHDLEFLVRERLDRRHSDGIAGMDAHWVEVLDGTNDDAIVLAVAHDLHLELLPAQERFLDEDLGHGREFEAALGHLVELLAVVSDAAASAAERERRPNNEREAADLLRDQARFFGIVGRAADGDVQPDGQHQVLEHLPVFAALDGLGIGANHLDAIVFQRPAAEERHGGIERGLAAERRQQHELALRLEALHLLDFPGDDFVDALGGDGLDVGAVGKLGIGHDRGRVRVHQNNAVAFLLERLASLGARVIKLARLPDDDRAGANDQDGMNVGALRHKSAGNKAHSTPVVSVKVVEINGVPDGSEGVVRGCAPWHRSSELGALISA